MRRLRAMQPAFPFPLWRALTSVVVFCSFVIPALGDLQLLSVPNPDSGPSASAGGDSYMPFVSADGRYVLFASTANNLTPDSSNVISLSPRPLKMNLYRRDRSNNVTTLVSVNLAGTGANDDCYPIALSTNGQFALFESMANDLVAADTNGVADVFVRDIEVGNTLLVSVSTNGFSANSRSYDSAMSADGRVVTFVSLASNLAPGDVPIIPDVFARDFQTGVTKVVNAGASNAVWCMYCGPQGGPWGTLGWPASSSDSPEITPDGRYVAFYSTTTNLVAGVSTVGEVYVRDLANETTIVASTNARAYFFGVPPDRLYSFNHVISADGQFVAFETYRYSAPTSILAFRKNLQTGEFALVATNVAPSLNQAIDMSPDGHYVAFIGKADPTLSTNATCIYVWDAQSATTRIISTNLDGSIMTNAVCDSPVFDPTGEFISFQSTATNLTTNAVSSEFHLYVHELATGTTKLVDVTTNGAGSKGTLWGAQSLSPGARFVAFDSDSEGLVANDGNQCSDVFLRDLVTGTTELISVPDADFPSQTAGRNDSSHRLSLSADGRFAAFAGTAAALLGNTTNRRHGVFVRDLLNGVNYLVSTDTNGVANGNGASVEPIISGNGRYVAFTSFANNLAAKDANRTSDVFVRDLHTGAISLISTNRFGTGSGNNASRLSSISADGRYVLFYSWAYDLAVNSSSVAENLYLRDRLLNITYVLTRGGVDSASMTPDGRFVAFVGSMDSPFGSYSLYAWDAQLAKGVSTNTSVGLRSVAISQSGRFIASESANLVIWDRIANTNISAGSTILFSFRQRMKFSDNERFLVYSTRRAKVGIDTNGADDVFLFDLQTATNILVSRSTNQISSANASSADPDISRDGRFIVYASFASDLVSSDSNRAKDVFLYDRQNGATTLLSTSAYGNGSANRSSTVPVFGGDGQTVMFQSFASDLIEQDFNQGIDAFLLRLPSANPVFTGQILFSPGSGEPPTIKWIAPPGNSYRVEFKNELSDAAWQPVNTTISVVNDIGQATDPTPNPNHRFYRIVAY